MQGRPNIPELLSNKIIMTQPALGNQRGAIWGDKTLQNQNWIADVEFRVNGPERGGGNLNIWLVRDGAHSVGSGSIYTTGKFEGLALVIDQHGGTGGMIRGFLNDGTVDYKVHHNVDNLAFGHCNFAYRNLGRPSQVKLRHSEHKFTVEVDGRLCFETDKVRIPSGYGFGITAASADTPDSFEVFKLVVLSEDSHNHGSTGHDSYQKPHDIGGAADKPTQQQQDPNQPKMKFGRAGQANVEDPYDNVIPDEKAEKITSSAAQFADLHNRLQSVNHHLSTIFRSIAQNAAVGEQRHEETSVMLGELKGLINRIDMRLDKLDVSENRLRDIEKEMRSLRTELSAKLRESENAIKYHVSDKHEHLAEHVETYAAPGHSKLFIVIIGSQLLLLSGYIYYKRKKSSPKKYL